MENVGWRGACFAYAAIHICICLPTYLAAIPEPPKAPPSSTPRPDKLEDGHSARNEFRAFLLLASVLTVGSAVMSVVGIHVLRDEDLTSQRQWLSEP